MTFAVAAATGAAGCCWLAEALAGAAAGAVLLAGGGALAVELVAGADELVLAVGASVVDEDAPIALSGLLISSSVLASGASCRNTLTVTLGVLLGSVTFGAGVTDMLAALVGSPLLTATMAGACVVLLEPIALATRSLSAFIASCATVAFAAGAGLASGAVLLLAACSSSMAERLTGSTSLAATIIVSASGCLCE